MAQSSLSQFLQQYEAELGAALFVRTSKGLRPTMAGNHFIENARVILHHYRLAANEIYDMKICKRAESVLASVLSVVHTCCR